MRTPQMDPWQQIEDLDGQAHYRVLGLERSASLHDVMRAYRRLARQHHPDKGGDARRFAALQAAVAVLGDRDQRRVYDELAGQLQWRYIPRGATGGDEVEFGMEGALLDEFESLTGLTCDPHTQLIVTCEMCRRPATKDCWVCAMPICEFCTRKQHWKGSFALHWPLVNSAHMMERLGRRQLEQKRLEDAQRQLEQDAKFRSEAELQVLRDFKDAAVRAAGLPDRQVRYSYALARHYMWSQTDRAVFVACHVPTGSSECPPVVEVAGSSLLVQSRGGPPAIDRLLAYDLEPCAPVETTRTANGRFLVMVLRKAAGGRQWARLFRGDSDGVRCLQQPYRLIELEDEVVLELDVPFWVDSSDVEMHVEHLGLMLEVRGQVSLARRFWRDRSRSGYQAVVEEQCSWCLDTAAPPAPLRRPVAATSTHRNDDSEAAGRRQHHAGGTQPPPLRRPVTAPPDEAAGQDHAGGQQQQQQPLRPAAAAAMVGDAAGGGVFRAALSVRDDEAMRRAAADETVGQRGADSANGRASPKAGAALAPIKREAQRTGAVAAVEQQVPSKAPRRVRTLTVTLPRPLVTSEEQQYKKGVRQDNRAAARADGRPGGCCFFADDEDEFGLQALLQAHMLHEAGWAHVPGPSGAGGQARRVTNARELPQAAQQHLASIVKRATEE